MVIKRVLLVINVRWWNAEAAYALNLARGLISTGVRVWIMVNPDSPVHKKAVEKGIDVVTDIALDSHNPFVQGVNLKKILSHIDHKRIDLVNSFKSNGAFLFSLARYLRPGLTYVKTRGVAVPPRKNGFNRYLYGPKGCDGIVTVGKSVRKWMETLLGTDHAQKVATIYYGDSPIREVGNQEDPTGRVRFGISEKAVTLSLLGRTQPIKGHLVLLEALHLTANPKLHVIFLVKDLAEYPDEMRQIEDYIDANQLQGQVTILGFRHDLGSVFSVIDCGVIPSLESEVNCRVCVEFFSAGIPVISFPTGTLPDIVEHKKNGYLCREKSANGLAQALMWAYENRIELQQSGERAQQDYMEKYSLERLAADTLSFYETCLKKNHSRNRGESA